MKPALSGALSFVLLLSAARAMATPRNAALRGRVVDESQRPLEGVRVTVSSPALSIQRTTVTDASGDYCLPQLPEGHYTVLFEKECFGSQAKQEVRLHPYQNLMMSVGLPPLE